MRRALLLGVLLYALPASAGMATLPAPRAPVRCVATNVGTTPLAAVWIEFLEATNDGTVETQRPCLALPPEASCFLVTDDTRAARCRVQWAGGDRDVLVVVAAQD